MSNKKKIIDLLQSKGLLFPVTEKEVEQFELYNAIENENPADWDAPEAILKRGFQKIPQLKTIGDTTLNPEIQELRMVARKGSNLPKHVIDKMNMNHTRNDK